jgi:hypothetical protein
MLTPPLHLTVAFKWPSSSTAQLVVSMRYSADPAPQSLGSVVYLWWEASRKRRPGLFRPARVRPWYDEQINNSCAKYCQTH